MLEAAWNNYIILFIYFNKLRSEISIWLIDRTDTMPDACDPAGQSWECIPAVPSCLAKKIFRRF